MKVEMVQRREKKYRFEELKIGSILRGNVTGTIYMKIAEDESEYVKEKGCTIHKNCNINCISICDGEGAHFGKGSVCVYYPDVKIRIGYPEYEDKPAIGGYDLAVD